MFNQHVKCLIHGRIVARVIIAAIIIPSLVVGCGKSASTDTPFDQAHDTPFDQAHDTPVPPTTTKVPPTATLLPPTTTPMPPTVTSEPFTDTPIPPSAAAPPSETPLPQAEPLPVLAEWSGTQGPVYGVDWSPDGRTIATTGRRHVRLWDGETYEELATLQGFDGFVWNARWSPDGSLLAVANAAGPIRLYDARTYSVQSTLGEENVHHIAWSPAGRLLAAGTAFSRRVQVWNVETGALAYELQGDFGVSGLAWSPNRPLLASVGWDSTVRLWDVETGQAVGAGECDSLSFHSVAWSPDGQRVVAGRGLYHGWNTDETLCVVAAP